MEATGPGGTTIHAKFGHSRRDVLEYFRACIKFFENNPAKLDVIGIFTAPSDRDKAKSKENLAFKDFLRNKALSDDPSILINLMNRLLCEDTRFRIPKNIVDPCIKRISRGDFGGVDFIDLIGNLMKSDEANDRQLGEILYLYCHLAKLVTEHAKNNQMDAFAVGRQVGPVIVEVLGAAEGQSYNFVPNVKEAARKAFEKDYFEASFGEGEYFPFDEFYRKKIEHLSPEVKKLYESAKMSRKESSAYGEVLKNVENKIMDIKLSTENFNESLKRKDPISKDDQKRMKIERKKLRADLEVLSDAYALIKQKAAVPIKAAVRVEQLLQPAQRSIDDAEDKLRAAEEPPTPPRRGGGGGRKP